MAEQKLSDILFGMKNEIQFIAERTGGNFIVVNSLAKLLIDKGVLTQEELMAVQRDIQAQLVQASESMPEENEESIQEVLDNLVIE